MAAFNLYRANCIGNEWNCLYPHKVCAGDEESLRQAVCQDYVAVEYAKGYRSNENFIRTNCLALDCDNGHSENPEEWVSPEKILSLFPDVTVGFHFSRHHNLPKEGKSARPRFHCFFLIDEMTDPETYKNLKKQINSIFPYFDTKALDAARFFYGTRDPQVQFHEGTITLNECLDLYYPDNEEAFANLPLPDASGIIPEGSRNATMSHFAGKLLKRLGETEEARQKFLEKAASCVPPLEQRELDTIWHSAVRFYRKISQSEDYVSPEEYAARHGDFLYRPSDNSDVAEARVLAEVFSGQMRYSPATDFIVYNGDIWEESKPRAHAIMHDLSDMQLEEASTAATEAYKILEQNGAADLMNKESKKKAQSDMNDDQLQVYLTYMRAIGYQSTAMNYRQSKNIKAVLAEVQPMVLIRPQDLDADPFLLNTPECAYDLRLGLAGAMPHSADHFVTKMTAVQPGEDGKALWQDALNLFFCGDKELIHYVQQVAGMIAVGKVFVEALIIAYGDGRNGKSTFWNTLAHVLGTYSGNISADALTVGCKRNVRPELAEAKGKRMQSAWTQAGESLTAISKKCETISKAMTKAGKSLTTHVTAPITALGTAAVKASIDYEYAFADVRKTVDATEEEYDRLSDSVKQMSTEVAASAEEIAEVMSIAGQLGIENEHLAEFTRTMIDLGNSTNLVAADAASEAARFANIMGMSQGQFQNLGSALVDLGNNYATTESEILAMSMRLAGAGKQVGLSEAQILGFATALSSVGIEAQMGGSAFSKALVKMEVASATGGDALEDFAKVSGMTAKQFKALWDSDPAAAFQSFIVGLSKMDEEGESAIATLEEIGIKEVRLRDTLLRSTNATELFSRAQETANRAWRENAALTNEANKRYATTKSRLTNLKNTALMFARQIGDDLNPTIQQIIDKANALLQKFLSLDAMQRQSIVKWAAFAAAVGPVVLVLGKVVGAVGTVTGALGKAFTAIGKFSASVSMAGGGIGGLVKVLASSKVAMVALAAALVYGAVKLVDVASGAKAAREALEGMAKTAKSWKETAAETFYGSSQGLSFFGMSKDDFKRATGNSREWLNGLLDVWSDGKKETNEIVSEWTDSFKSLTASTREELTSLKETADQAGYSSVSAQLRADIDTLDSMDKEIARLLNKKQNRKLSERDKVRLQELIDTREAIEVKYHLSAADTDGFDTIRNKVEAEVARAEARGQEVSATVYENAMVAAAEGMSAVNSSLDEQYDKEYALIQLIENSTERQQALDALNAKYNSDRRAAAMEYAQLMADVVMPVWQQSDIQTAKTQVGDLMQLLRQYSAASTDAEKKSFLPQLNQLTSSMDEGALTEYVALLTQIQSLLDSGMSETEVQAMFPDIDFSSALEQLAAIQTYLNQNKWDTNLTSLNEMFGEAVGEEVLKITTDLDMTGAQARWNEWASNPGAITTDAVIQGYTEAENATKQQPLVDAFVAKYTEQPEGADKSSLTPAGLVAYVQTYAEATTGTDVSGLNPTNVTAMVSAYKELASGTDVTQLKPSEITAYVFKYLEDNKVDTTGLTPEAVTAFVMAYEEVTGGASTAALKPTDVVGLITKYAEAENVDVSALTSAQVEGIVTKFAEATGCDKSELLREFTAYITEYKEAAGVKKPTLNMQVGLSGYDLLAYRRWLRNNKVEVEGVVRLSEVYEDPSGVLGESGVKYWKDGEEIPVTAVTSDMLRPEDVAILDKDGTMHILLTTEITGAPEAIAEMREQVAEVDQLGMTAIGTALTGIMPKSLMDYIDAAEQRIKNAKGDLDQWYNFIYGGNEGIMRTLNQSMINDFDPENVAQLATYVSEVVTAIQSGQEVGQEDIDNLNKILQFVQDLDSVGVGQNVTEGIAEGMTAAGWDTSAETLATNLETAINSALIINSPSERMKPAGEYVAAGIGAGMGGYDFSTDAATLATNLETAITAALTAESLTPSGTGAMAGLAGALTAYDMSGAGTTVSANVKNAVSRNLTATSLKSIGTNAMAGLKAGINAGRSGVVSAIQSAARAAVNAAKKELKIASPSRVFRDEIGSMTMKGFGEGVLQESRVQARTIRNAARFLTGEAKEGAIAFGNNDNRKTYNQTSSVNLSGNNFYVRDEQDIRSLAIEIATLTKRQQRGRGLRMA